MTCIPACGLCLQVFPWEVGPLTNAESMSVLLAHAVDQCQNSIYVTYGTCILNLPLNHSIVCGACMTFMYTLWSQIDDAELCTYGSPHVELLMPLPPSTQCTLHLPSSSKSDTHAILFIWLCKPRHPTPHHHHHHHHTHTLAHLIQSPIEQI